MMFAFFINLLTAILIGLKLGGLITWSWSYVLFPTIVLVGLLGFMLMVSIITMVVIATYDAMRSDRYD